MIARAILFLALVLTAAASFVAGAYLLLGIGWSLIVLGVCAAALAAWLREGIKPVA